MGLLGGLVSQGQPQGQRRGPVTPQHVWVVRIEHGFLRAVSLVFSFGSAYAISQVFAPPHPGDVVRLAVDLGIAAGFGVLGYFLSRSIAYRLMQRESVWAYVPICLVVEFVEIFCNYVMGVSEVPHAEWLQSVPLSQRPILTGLSYVVLSIIPAVTLFLAVADMDLERRKTGQKPKQVGGPQQSVAWGNQQPYQTYQQGYQQPQAGSQGQGGGSNGNNPLPGLKRGN